MGPSVDVKPYPPRRESLHYVNYTFNRKKYLEKLVDRSQTQRKRDRYRGNYQRLPQL
jgi:hypothetical protein